MLRGTLGWLLGAVLCVTLAGGARADDYRTARVSDVRGDLAVRGEAEGDVSYIERNAVIREGDTLWTVDDSRAELELEAGSWIRLAEDTKLDLRRLPPGPTELEIWNGSVYLDLSDRLPDPVRLRTPAGDVDVDPNSVVRVDLSKDDDVRVSIYSGHARVTPDRGGPIRLSNGDRVYLAPDKDVDPPKSFDRDDLDSFDRYHRDRIDYYISRPLPRELQHDIIGARDLNDYGSWVSLEGSTYWRPRTYAGWQPYSYGYWSYVPSCGYTWIDYAPWAYTTCHYGSWLYRPTYGWLWSPGYVWGPSYVYWASYGDYCGWAPLDPFGRPCYYGPGTFCTTLGLVIDNRCWSFCPRDRFFFGRHHRDFGDRPIVVGRNFGLRPADFHEVRDVTRTIGVPRDTVRGLVVRRDGIPASQRVLGIENRLPAARLAQIERRYQVPAQRDRERIGRASDLVKLQRDASLKVEPTRIVHNPISTVEGPRTSDRPSGTGTNHGSDRAGNDRAGNDHPGNDRAGNNGGNTGRDRAGNQTPNPGRVVGGGNDRTRPGRDSETERPRTDQSGRTGNDRDRNDAGRDDKFRRGGPPAAGRTVTPNTGGDRGSSDRGPNGSRRDSTPPAPTGTVPGASGRSDDAGRRDQERRDNERRDNERRQQDQRQNDQRDQQRKDDERRQQEQRDSDRRERERRQSEQRDQERRQSEQRENERRQQEARDTERRQQEQRENERRESERRDNERRQQEQRENERRQQEQRQEQQRQEQQRQEQQRQEQQRQEQQRQEQQRQQQRDNDRRRTSYQDFLRPGDSRTPNVGSPRDDSRFQRTDPRVDRGNVRDFGRTQVVTPRGDSGFRRDLAPPPSSPSTLPGRSGAVDRGSYRDFASPRGSYPRPVTPVPPQQFGGSPSIPSPSSGGYSRYDSGRSYGGGGSAGAGRTYTAPARTYTPPSSRGSDNSGRTYSIGGSPGRTYGSGGSYGGSYGRSYGGGYGRR